MMPYLFRRCHYWRRIPLQKQVAPHFVLGNSHGVNFVCANRISTEATMLISCVGWLESLAAGETPAVNLRPADDLPETCYVGVDQGRVIRMLRRIAHDLEELARTKRLADLSTRTNDADPRLRLHRSLAEPPIEISLRGTSIPQSRQAWADYESHMQKAGFPAPANPYRHLDRSDK
jgi:hypothetical protein